MRRSQCGPDFAGTSTRTSVHMHSPMHLGLRLSISVVHLTWTGGALRAQATELPPIFAPRPPSPTVMTVDEVRESRPPSPIRMLLNAASERVLADAKAFESPPSLVNPDLTLEGTTSPTSATVLLPQYIVKSTVLSRQQVERPNLPLVRPYVVEREGRPGLVDGYTFPVWLSRDGSKELNLNLINFAGRGVDHARDFGRVEVEFKIRF